MNVGRRVTVEADVDDHYLTGQGLHFITSTLSVVSFNAKNKTVVPDLAIVEAGRARMVFSDANWVTGFDDAHSFIGTIIFKDHSGSQASAAGLFKRAQPDTSGLVPKK